MTHVSGLPDQLPENDALRKKHAPLAEFVEHAIRTPLAFRAGLALSVFEHGHPAGRAVAEKLSGTDILTLVDRAVFQPLDMKHTAQGLGRFAITDLVPMQTDRAAPESGGGDPTAKDWDWNSPYWRKLGAPWGGTHASAPDIARLLAEFLDEKGAAVKPQTARLMVTEPQSRRDSLRAAWDSTSAHAAGSKGCSEKTFGHTGSTGTIAWADPASHTICVVLTSLPARAVQPHPRDLAAASVAAAS